ncbi:MAG: hypothetical protein ACR2QC_07805 [Gammaproteobacteria bacterium]
MTERITDKELDKWERRVKDARTMTQLGVECERCVPALITEIRELHKEIERLQPLAQVHLDTKRRIREAIGDPRTAVILESKP